MKLNHLLPVAMGILLTLSSCAEKKKEDAKEEQAPTEEQVEQVQEPATVTPNIVGVAVGNEQFSKLVAALKAAELVGVLEGEGPFTVFAPTNAAFKALPDGTLDELLLPENKERLAGVLTYHVVSGKFMAADVVKGITDNNGSLTVTTVQGQDITLSLNGESVTVTDAFGNVSNIAATDVAASNGVIHVLDAVILPAAE